jgi:hypothetical protein
LAPSAGITATNQYGQRSFGGNRRNPPMMMRPTAPTLSPMMREVLRQAQMKKTQEAQQTASGTGIPGTTPPATTQAAGGQPSGFMSAFSQPLTSPVGQAISQAAIAGARASDYSPTPVSLGRVLAEMGAAASGGYMAGEERERQIKADERAARLANLQAMTAYAKATRGEKPTLKMLPVEGGGTQLAMIDPYTGDILQKIGGVKPPSGFGVEILPDGTTRITQGAGGGLEKGTKKDLEGDISNLTGQISMLDQAAATYDPELLTYGAELESLYGTTLAKINPSMLSAEQKDKLTRRTQFVRGVQQTFSTLLNQLSGAAVSNFELGNARKYSVNPNDDPISFEAKLRDQRGFANAALFRAQQILGGEPITTNLAQKYPISITGKNSQGETKTLYMHEFVNKYMAANDADQATAIAAYAEAAKKARQ